MKINKHLGRIYFICAGLMGMAFVFLMPPFRVVDEQRHYIAAGALAEGRIVCNEGKHEISRYKVDLIKKMGMFPDALWPEPGFDWNYVWNYREDSIGTTQVRGILCSVPLYGHTPAALGLMLGNSFHLNELASFYLGRVFNLFFGIILLAAAIYLTPYFKRTFFVIGILPTTLFHFASITYDSLVIPGLLMCVGVLFYIQKKRSITLKVLILVVPGILAMVLKPFYLPMITAICFWLYIRSDEINKRKLRIIIGLVFILIIYISANAALRSGPIEYNGVEFKYEYFHEGYEHLVTNTPYKFDSREQFSRLFVEPWVFPLSTLLTIIYYGTFNLQEMVGYLGWEREFMGWFVTCLVVLAAILFIKEERFIWSMSKRDKLFIIFGTVISWLSIYLFMFLFLTIKELPIINGVQGKYFIPYILPMVMILYRSDGYGGKNRKYIYWLTLMFMFMVIFTTVVLRFFDWYAFSR